MMLQLKISFTSNFWSPHVRVLHAIGAVKMLFGEFAGLFLYLHIRLGSMWFARKNAIVDRRSVVSLTRTFYLFIILLATISIQFSNHQILSIRILIPMLWIQSNCCATVSIENWPDEFAILYLAAHIGHLNRAWKTKDSLSQNVTCMIHVLHNDVVRNRAQSGRIAITSHYIQLSRVTFLSPLGIFLLEINLFQSNEHGIMARLIFSHLILYWYSYRFCFVFLSLIYNYSLQFQKIPTSILFTLLRMCWDAIICDIVVSWLGCHSESVSFAKSSVDIIAIGADDIHPNRCFHAFCIMQSDVSILSFALHLRAHSPLCASSNKRSKARDWENRTELLTVKI